MYWEQNYAFKTFEMIFAIFAKKKHYNDIVEQNIYLHTFLSWFSMLMEPCQIILIVCTQYFVCLALMEGRELHVIFV